MYPATASKRPGTARAASRYRHPICRNPSTHKHSPGHDDVCPAPQTFQPYGSLPIPDGHREALPQLHAGTPHTHTHARTHALTHTNARTHAHQRTHTIDICIYYIAPQVDKVAAALRESLKDEHEVGPPHVTHVTRAARTRAHTRTFPPPTQALLADVHNIQRCIDEEAEFGVQASVRNGPGPFTCIHYSSFTTHGHSTHVA